MKPAPALWFKVSCIKTNLPDGCICTQKVLFSGGRSLFWRSKHRACPSSMPAGGRPACQLRAKAGRASSHLAARPLSLSHLPCEETTARTNANAAALPSCRPARPTSAGPQAAFRTHPRGCHALEGPRAWGWVQDGAEPPAEGSVSACGSPCTVAVPGRCGVAPGGAPLPAARLQPWQRLLFQLLGFSLASPAAPGAKHNTSPSLRLSAAPAAFCVQPPKEGRSASSQERLEDSHRGSTPPGSAAGPPETTLPRLTHVWGWRSHSLAAPRGAAVGGIHPLQQKLLLGTCLGPGCGSRSW